MSLLAYTSEKLASSEDLGRNQHLFSRLRQAAEAVAKRVRRFFRSFCLLEWKIYID